MKGRRTRLLRAYVTAAARREVARRRLDLAASLQLSDYSEKDADLAVLGGDCPRQRHRDRKVLQRVA